MHCRAPRFPSAPLPAARLHTTPARLIPLNHTPAFMGERVDKQITTGI